MATDAKLIDFEPEPLLPGLTDDGAELLETVESITSRCPQYSGKIVEKNAARVQSIVGARAMGFSVRDICSAYKLSPHTLAEIERRHGTKLATLKDRLARKFGVFVELGIDRAIREVGSMDIDKLMISLGIATEKMQLMQGEPSAIVGTVDAKQFSVASLQARLGRREVIDVTPTGSGGGNSTPTREAGRIGPASDASSDS